MDRESKKRALNTWYVVCFFSRNKTDKMKDHDTWNFFNKIPPIAKQLEHKTDNLFAEY